MDFHVFLSVFGVIFIAELPDKTALAALVLATRHRPLPVWLGAALALTVQSAIAVGAGSLFALLPARAVHIGTGIVFLISAVVMWRKKEEDEHGDEKKDDQPLGFWKTFGTTFMVLFIAEWGDLTQVGTAALAARYKMPFTVFLSSALALLCVAGIAVGIGNRAAKLLDPEKTKRIAAVVFAIVGVALVAGWL
jgi:putative Ca2+/H+ antiporter (TMEM165/GDT1 family)